MRNGPHRLPKKDVIGPWDRETQPFQKNQANTFNTLGKNSMGKCFLLARCQARRRDDGEPGWTHASNLGSLLATHGMKWASALFFEKRHIAPESIASLGCGCFGRSAVSSDHEGQCLGGDIP